MISRIFGGILRRRLAKLPYVLLALLAIVGAIVVHYSRSNQGAGIVSSSVREEQSSQKLASTLRVQRVSDLPFSAGDSPGNLHIQFVNERNGWLSTGQKLWKTEDAGLNWLSLYDAPDEIRQFQFIDPGNGWLMTLTTLYKTKDGGSTWIVSPQPIYPYAEGHLSAMRFLRDGRRGWIAGGVYKTIANRDKDDDDYIPSRYFSPDEKRVLHGAIYCTEDGGLTWRRQLLSPHWGHFTVLFVLDSEHAWAAGTAGVFYFVNGKWSAHGKGRKDPDGVPGVKSLDVRIGYPTIEPASIFFLNSNSGWLSNSNGYLARSSDGGKTWKDIFPPVEIVGDAPDDFTQLFFLDQMNGWACGWQHGLYTTRDGGLSWERMKPHIDFKAMYFLESGSGWAVSEDGLFHLK